MAENIGGIYYEVSADTSKLIGQTGVVERETDRMGTAFTKVAGAVGVFVSSLAIAGAIQSAVNASRIFEKTLADLSAITGAVGKDLDALKLAAKEMASTSTASATDAVEAMKLIASAKPELLETSGALAAVTKQAVLLAEASGMDLPAAAEAVTLSLNQFGEGANQAARFVNVLAAGAKFGASEIADTAIALKNAAVSAASAKVSFEETNAALQALAANGIKGGEAGTALRNVLLKLENETDSKLRPSVNGLAIALANLEAKNLSSAEMTKLFGLENVNAAQSLVRSADAVRTLTQQLTGTNTASEQAAVNTNTLDASIKRMNNALDLAAQKLGDDLLPFIRSASESVRSLALAFAEGSEGIKAAASVAEIAVVGLAGFMVAKFVTATRAAVVGLLEKIAATKAAAAAEVAALAGAQATAASYIQTAAASRIAALAAFDQAAANYALARAAVQLLTVQAQQAAANTKMLAGTAAYFQAAAIERTVTAQLTAAKVAETEATVVLTAAQVRLAAARGQEIFAATAATASTAALTAAQTAQASATTAAAVAGRTAAGVLAALGGPIGIAVTALILLALNWQKVAGEARDAATMSEQAAARIATALKKSPTVAAQDLGAQLKDAREELALIEKELGRSGANMASGQDLAELRQRRNMLLKIAADVERAMAGNDKRGRRPANEGGGRVTNAGTTSMQPELKPVKFDGEGYLAGLERATAEGLERVSLIEQEALRKNTQMLAEGKISRETAAKAVTLIEANAVFERQAIQRAAGEEYRARVEADGQKDIALAKRLADEKTRGQQFATGILGQGDEALRLQLELEAKSALLVQYAERDQENLALYAQAKVALEKQTADQIAEIANKRNAEALASQAQVLQGYGSLFGSLADITKGFAGEQSGAYKAMFAVSKAFAIADSIVKIQQGIAGAMSLPFPANIAAAASTAAAAAGIVSTIQGANFGGGRQYGGPVSADSMYRVNEGGRPEMFTATNGAQYMMPTADGRVTPAGGGAGGSGGWTLIVNHAPAGMTFTPQVDESTRTVTLAVAEVAAQVTERRGQVWGALRGSTNVQARL